MLGMLGLVGAHSVVAVIALVTLYFQLNDPVYRSGVLWVALWFAIGTGYFAVIGRHRLVLSPEEEFALGRRG